MPPERTLLKAHLSILAALLCATGCVPFASSAPLPTATATLHFATIELPRGSYCWNTGGSAQCADSAGPDQLLKSGYLKPYRTAGGFDARINFKGAAPPHGFGVQLVMTPPGVSAPSAVPSDETLTFSVPAVTPGAAGVYVYVVTGTWTGSGDVSFFLALDLLPGAA